MSALRTLVMDDDHSTHERLEKLLERKSDANLVSTCTSGEEAAHAIHTMELDLVLLSARMPETSGLDVVRRANLSTMPAVVFVAADDQHALEAFDLAALDYILKPVEGDRFEQAWNKARNWHHSQQDTGFLTRKMSRLLTEIDTTLEDAASGEVPEDTEGYLDRVAVSSVGEMRVVPVEMLRYIRADGSNLKLYTEEDAHLVHENLKTLESRLDPRRFCRIHRSTIVSLDCIEAIQPHPEENGHAVRLDDGTHLKISRSRKRMVKKRLGVLRRITVQ